MIQERCNYGIGIAIFRLMEEMQTKSALHILFIYSCWEQHMLESQEYSKLLLVI